MKQSLNRQSGMTFLGLCFVLAFIAIVVLFVLRAFPLYNERFQVESALQTVVSQPDAASSSAVDLRKSFMRAMAVTNINRFTDRNVKDHLELIKSKKKGEPNSIRFHYEATNRLFADLSLLLTFDKTIAIGASIE